MERNFHTIKWYIQINGPNFLLGYLMRPSSFCVFSSYFVSLCVVLFCFVLFGVCFYFLLLVLFHF